MPARAARELQAVGGLDPRAPDGVLREGTEVMAPVWLLEFAHRRRCFRC